LHFSETWVVLSKLAKIRPEPGHPGEMAHKVDTKWIEPGLDNGDIIGDSSGDLPEDIDGLILNQD